MLHTVGRPNFVRRGACAVLIIAHVQACGCTAFIINSISTGDFKLPVGRYRATGNTASAVALLEAAVREHEQGLGLRHRGVTALTRRAEEWFEELPPSDVSDVRLRVRLLLGRRGVLPVDKSGAGHLSGRCWHVAVTE
jgi:hypothetical protein